MKAPGVDGLEAGPLSPKFPVGNNTRRDRNTQLLFIAKDAVGIVGSEDGGGNTSEPTNEVEVILTRPRTAQETARGKLGREDIEDEVTDVGNVSGGSLEETILGLFRDLVVVDLEETTIGGNLLIVEGLEFGSFWGSRDAFEGSLT